MAVARDELVAKECLASLARPYLCLKAMYIIATNRMISGNKLSWRAGLTDCLN